MNCAHLLTKRSGVLLSSVFALVLALAGGIFLSATALGQAKASQVHVVRMEMQNYRFTYQPETMVVNVGDTVEWVNDDMYAHNVYSDDHTFHSPTIDPKGSWRYKAVKKGTYHYYCTFHPNMKGTLVVR